MHKSLKYSIIIFLIIVVFLLGLLIISYEAKNKTSDTFSNTLSNDDLFKVSNSIPDNITKIKISKFNTSDSNPFICYISDDAQIQSFVNNLNNIDLDKYNGSITFSPIYTIELLGDITTTIQVSTDKILQISTWNNTYFKLSTESFSDISDLTDVKYYLHDSSLDEPSKDTCMNAQSIILSGLSNVEISNLRKQIHDVHSQLEFYLVDNVETLKNSNNIYWEPATIDEVFTQPNGVKIQSHGFWQYRDSLQDLLELNLNDSARSILNTIISTLQNGMDNHDLSECFEFHKLLHDFDYWIVNYPVGSFYAAPADWDGLNCYFGTIEEFHINQ